MKTKLMTYEQAMAKKGLEDKDVYTKLGVCKQTWSQVKNYETQIKADAFLNFCDLADCDPRMLVVKGYNL